MLCLLIIGLLSLPWYARGQGPLGSDGLPGIREVPLLDTLSPFRLQAQGTLHYGLTEELADQAGTHHRVGLDLAAALAVSAHGSLAIELQGRHDRHRGTTEAEADQGTYLRTRLHARGQLALSPQLSLGTQATVLVPAASSLSDGLSGTGFAVDALLGLSLAEARLGARLGLRWDRGFKGLPGDLSIPDRIAIDVSGQRELRLGLAALFPALGIDWGVEWSWDIALGNGGATPLQSPMWVRGGPYVDLGSVRLALLAGISPSARPALSQAPTLIRLEPRLWAGIQVASSWNLNSTQEGGASRSEPAEAMEKLRVEVRGYRGAPVSAAAVQLAPSGSRCSTDTDGQCDLTIAAGPGQVTIEADDYIAATIAYDSKRRSTAEPATVEVTLQVAPLTLRGVVLQRGQVPLPDAHVSVMRDDQQRNAKTDDQGRFTVAELSAGELAIRIEADQVATTQHTFSLRPGHTTATLTANPLTDTGQLRGRIRALDGHPLVASVRIQPGHITLKSDDSGEFELELDEGLYTVDIRAPGYITQSRAVKVERYGVVVMLVDLRDQD